MAAWPQWLKIAPASFILIPELTEWFFGLGKPGCPMISGQLRAWLGVKTKVGVMGLVLETWALISGRLRYFGHVCKHVCLYVCAFIYVGLRVPDTADLRPDVRTP